MSITKKIRYKCIILLLFAISAIVVLTSCGETETYTYTGFAMGTVVSETIYSSGKDISESVIEVLSDTEKNRLSWREKDSEIARINQRSGAAEWKQVSSSTRSYIEKILAISKQSNGALDPTVGDLTRLWGFDGSDPTVPKKSSIKSALATVGYENIKTNGSQIMLNKQANIDLGAVGKGIGCDEIKKMLEKEKAVSGGIFNIGGSSILTYGSKPDHSPWKVAITDPRNEDQLGVLTLEGDHHISTSGDYEKYFIKENERYHHILNPDNGYPANSGLISVTIICDDGVTSDGLSTACFVLGKEKALKLIDQYEVEAVLVDKEKNVYMTEGIRDDFTLIADGYQISGN